MFVKCAVAKETSSGENSHGLTNRFLLSVYSFYISLHACFNFVPKFSVSNSHNLSLIIS